MGRTGEGPIVSASMMLRGQSPMRVFGHCNPTKYGCVWLFQVWACMTFKQQKQASSVEVSLLRKWEWVIPPSDGSKSHLAMKYIPPFDIVQLVDEFKARLHFMVGTSGRDPTEGVLEFQPLASLCCWVYGSCCIDQAIVFSSIPPQLWLPRLGSSAGPQAKLYV